MTEKPTAEEAAVNTFLTENRSFLGPDLEIMADHHLAPRTAREEAVLADGFDTHLMADIRATLTAALDETFNIAELTVASAAASVGDMTTSLYTAVGDLAMAATRGVAGFNVGLHYTIRYILKYFKDDPTVGIRPGDAFLINDARYGGIHSPDQHMFMPIFAGEELVAWCCCAMHEGEIGAKVPGGMGPTIESPWDEGFRGSPIKIVENYQLKLDLVNLLQNNSREPQVQVADLKARLAACKRMRQRFHEQMEQHSTDTMIAFLRSNIEFMAEEARSRIADLPDGTVRITQYTDDTMREAALLKMSVAITIKGDRVIYDMRGSSPEIFNRPINTLGDMAVMGAAIPFSLHIWPDMPCMQAVINQFDFVFDEGSMLNCSMAVPIALCMVTGFKYSTASEIAFSKLYYGAPKRYGKTKAGWFNQAQAIIYGGINQHYESVGNMCCDINGMGGAAKFDGDGEHSVAPFFGAAVDVGESEHMEENLPYIYAISKKFWPDNTGFGKYRGGSGYQYGLMRYGAQPFGFQTFAGGASFPSTQGLFGGYACSTYAVCRIRGKNLFDEFKNHPEKFDTDMFSLMESQPFEGATYESLSMAVPFDFYTEGELFMMSQGAGGGYGDCLERDPALVVKDLEEGIVSHEIARDLYKVVVDSDTLVVDDAATAAARDAERQDRIERGMDWDEFVATHVKDEPPTDIPFFGSWNDSEELYAGPYGKALPGQHPPIMLPDPTEVELATTKAELAALKSQLAEQP